jgi:hypothetical protein
MADYVVVSGGLGTSQCGDLANALRAAGFNVVETPQWCGYKYVRETILALPSGGKLALVGHSFTGISLLDAGAAFKAVYVGLIDPVDNRIGQHSYSIPAGGRLDDWFIRSDWDLERKMEIPNAPIAPQVIQGGHNSIPKNSILIQQVIRNIRQAFLAAGGGVTACDSGSTHSGVAATVAPLPVDTGAA